MAGLFAAGGTGEFFSLTPDEVETVVRAAVAETADRVPVIAGAGYGTEIAIDLARRADCAGREHAVPASPEPFQRQNLDEADYERMAASVRERNRPMR